MAGRGGGGDSWGQRSETAARVLWPGHGFWLVSPLDTVREGPQTFSPRWQLLSVSVTHKNRWSPPPGDAALGRREKMGTPFCPSLPRKPKPNVGKDQAGSGPAGRQTGLAKLPITSQTFQGPLGVAPPPPGTPPRGAPTSAGPHSSLSFHPVEKAEGQGHADPGPDTWRSVRFPGHQAPLAVSATSGSGQRPRMRCRVECPPLGAPVSQPNLPSWMMNWL